MRTGSRPSLRQRVVFLSEYFPPDTGGASTRAANLVHVVEELGLEAVVVTSFPHYPDGNVATQYRRKALVVERTGTHLVIRTWIPPLAHDAAFKRSILYLAFCFMSLSGLLFTGRRTKAVWALSPKYFAAIPAAGLQVRLSLQDDTRCG